MSWAPPRASVPSLKTVNPSPPAARKLFIVTRNESVGATSTPAAKSRPILSAQAVAAAFCSYLKVFDTCRTRCTAWPPQPGNCCSSRRRSMSPVIVLVTRLLPNGWTVNASP